MYFVFLVSGSAMASTSVAWLSPVDGSTYPVGTNVALDGQASAHGIGYLDLVLVMDSSGSMSYNGAEGQLAQRNAATALVNDLSQHYKDYTFVGIVEFDSDANTVIGLTPLSTGKQDVINAINSVDASSGTDIADGVTEAQVCHFFL